MSRMFRMIHLNVRKQDTVLESLMNDEEVQNANVLAIQEPGTKNQRPATDNTDEPLQMEQDDPLGFE